MGKMGEEGKNGGRLLYDRCPHMRQVRRSSGVAISTLLTLCCMEKSRPLESGEA